VNTNSRRKFLRGGAATLVAPAALAAQSTGNSTLEVIRGLRTIHGDFSEKQVSEKDLRLILNASVRAANASGMQTYSILVSRDAGKIRKLTGYTAPSMLLYAMDYTRVIDSAKHVGYEFYADNILDFITASTNTILAAQTAVIAARSVGIDSLLTNGIHRRDPQVIWSTLELPETGCFPLIALLLGYPKKEPDHQKGRLSGPGVLHEETFHRLTAAELDAIVKQYDDKTQHVGLNDDWDRAGHKHYLDWLYKDWLKARTKPSQTETPWFKRLRKSGFVDMQQG
jgi:nitroreductase